MFASLADYHVHTPLCHHAAGWPVEFAARALELGLGVLGLDHNPMAEPFDNWCMASGDLPLLISSDAHAVGELIAGFAEAVALSMSAGR